MKVYIVSQTTGLHDDIGHKILKVFADKLVAERYVEKKNAQLQRLKDYSIPIVDEQMKEDLFSSSYCEERHWNIVDLNEMIIEEHNVI